MSLKDLLMDDLKDAMRDKEKVKKSVITMLRSAVKQIEVDERRDLSDDDVVDIMTKQIKQKNNAIEDFNSGGRQDLVDLTREEIAILMRYMPEQLSEDEVVAVINDAIRTSGATSMKDMGKVMGIVGQATKGKADSKIVADLVKKALNS